MKKIILGAFSALILVTGCDLERLPNDAYTDTTIKEDPETTLDVLLNGNYSTMRTVYDTYIRFGEYRGDNVRKDKPTTAGYSIFYTWDRNPSAGTPNTQWNNCYKVISQASEIIKMFPEGESEALDQKLGEAYTQRGLMYFNLVNMFGRPYYQDPETNLGVPIVNGMPGEGLFNYEFPDRATVKAVYNQIVSDFKKAEQLCNTYSTIRASKEAAQAALAKAYIYMSGTFENPNKTYADSAYYYADKVIQSGKFQLLSRDNFMHYNEFTPEDATQTETIFACRTRFEDVSSRLTSQLGGQYSRIQNVGWGETCASSIAIDLLNEVGTNEWRKGHDDLSGIVDARAAFVVPDYELTDKKDPTSTRRAFVFVTKVYDNSGKATAYTYKQFIPAQIGNSNELISVKDEVTGSEYPVKVVDLVNRKYSIQYNNGTYLGYDDLYVNESMGHPRYYIYRCSLEEGNTQQHSPIVSRLSDVILIRAEASIKLNNLSAALEDINKIRERAIPGHGYKTLDNSNAKDRLMKERHLELMFHGERSIDVFRVGDSLSRPMPGWCGDPFRVMKPTDNDVVMYIPSQQIEAWPTKLTQNP